jgi:hypothetical protein
VRMGSVGTESRVAGFAISLFEPSSLATSVLATCFKSYVETLTERLLCLPSRLIVKTGFTTLARKFKLFYT